MKKIILTMLIQTFCFAFMQAEKINLVWQKKGPLPWSEDWIHELLEGSNIIDIEDGQYEIFKDNSIVIIILGEPSAKTNQYFEKLHSMNYKYAIIHLGDELYKAPRDFYEHAEFVLREYWHKNFVSNKNVYHLPLGYRNGFLKTDPTALKTSQQRDYIWSFAGQLTDKPTRQAMAQALKSIPRYYIYEIPSICAPSSLSAHAYQNVLLNTIFTPCPSGWWNLESFRVYEALECGSIPIVEKKPLDYFSLCFGEHPFLAVDSWDQAPNLINALLADPELLETRRLACQQWWLDYKDKVKENLQSIIHNKLMPQS